MSALLARHSAAVAAAASCASASRRADSNGASSKPFAPLSARKSVTTAAFTGGRSQLSSSSLRLHSSTSAAAASTRSVAAATSSSSEEVFFDSGPHIGDLALNLVLGLTGVWLPLTLASVFRVLTLRYRFTNRRFTVLSELDEKERLEYPYSLVSEVRSAPRFIGEWGDISITLKDKTVIDLKSVPKFRQVAKYCEEQAKAAAAKEAKAGGSSRSSSKGFDIAA
ncbi:hypothetical protein CLOM_g4236 [Closterium sp. NIES-68]|nr:hypothetical protein CLOM_g4236 [Closterium sp. NIES-68]GJP69277.1 hypothetical protein CLOP_g220 [Closterium sp. NIES-67]GJP73238.1 hypothetical protein CLOP_g3982 [Closterium sp. NIES-67]